MIFNFYIKITTKLFFSLHDAYNIPNLTKNYFALTYMESSFSSSEITFDSHYIQHFIKFNKVELSAVYEYYTYKISRDLLFIYLLSFLS